MTRGDVLRVSEIMLDDIIESMLKKLKKHKGIVLAFYVVPQYVIQTVLLGF